MASSLSSSDPPVASIAIEYPTPRPLQTNEIYATSISNSPFLTSPLARRISDDLNEDDHLTLLLRKIDEQHLDTSLGDPHSLDAELRAAVAATASSPTAESSSPTRSCIKGNSVIARSGWSSKDNDDECGATKSAERPQSFSRSDSMTTSISSLRSPIDKHSYNSLLARHTDKSCIFARTVDLQDVWERFESSLGLPPESPTDENGDEESLKSLGFELLVSPSIYDKFTMQELHNFVEQSCHIATEAGIDAQGYLCRACPNPLGIGLTSTAPQVCSFTGGYFCANCMSSETFLMPARVIYNWDFRKYPVSRQSAAFLTDFQEQPFIDLKVSGFMFSSSKNILTY